MDKKNIGKLFHRKILQKAFHRISDLFIFKEREKSHFLATFGPLTPMIKHVKFKLFSSANSPRYQNISCPYGSHFELFKEYFFPYEKLQNRTLIPRNKFEFDMQEKFTKDLFWPRFGIHG